MIWLKIAHNDADPFTFYFLWDSDAKNRLMRLSLIFSTTTGDNTIYNIPATFDNIYSL